MYITGGVTVPTGTSIDSDSTGDVIARVNTGTFATPTYKNLGGFRQAGDFVVGATLSAGTPGQYLTSAGTGTPPTWTTITIPSGGGSSAGLPFISFGITLSGV